MNNIAGPIFNESFVEKRVCGSREQYMGPTGKHWNALLNEKKAWNVDALRFSSIQTDTIHNNESFVINFIKLLMHYIYSIFSYFLFCFVFFFVVVFFFFFCNSYFVQLFIFFSHCHFSSIFHPHQYIYKFSFDSLQIFKYFPLYFLKFYSFNLFNLSSTSTFPLPS